MQPPREQYADIRFPVNGLDQSAAFQDQRPGTTRAGSNVRAFEPLTQRMRGGSRAGLSRYLPQVPNGSHQVQLLAVVVDPSADALPWNFSFPGLNLPDPSSPGTAADWGPGRDSRTPGDLVPDGGWLYQPNKNLPQRVTVNWSRPADITVGTPLSSAQLDAQAVLATTGDSVAGTYAYNPAAGTVLGVGNGQPLNVTFAPADATFALPTTGSTAINVKSAGIQFVQAAQTHFNNGTLGTQTLAYPSNVGAGDLLLVALSNGSFLDNTVVTPTITDTQGNTYALLDSVHMTGAGDQTGRHAFLWLYYAFASSAGPNTVSVSFSPNAWNKVGLAVLEYTGVSSSSPVDAKAETTQETTPQTTLAAASVAAAANDEAGLAVFYYDQSGTSYVSTNGTLRSNAGYVVVVDKLNVSAGTVSLTVTVGTAAFYSALSSTLNPV